MDDESSETVEECLENALNTAEHRDTIYWIRTALQKLVVDAEFEEP